MIQERKSTPMPPPPLPPRGAIRPWERCSMSVIYIGYAHRAYWVLIIWLPENSKCILFLRRRFLSRSKPKVVTSSWYIEPVARSPGREQPRVSSCVDDEISSIVSDHGMQVYYLSWIHAAPLYIPLVICCPRRRHLVEDGIEITHAVTLSALPYC